MMELEGDKQLVRRLNALGPKVARKGARRALTKGGRVTTRGIKAGAPVRTGDLRKSIGQQTRKNRQTGEIEVIIGPRVKYRSRGKQAGVRYGHIVEYGSAPHTIETTFGGKRIRVHHPGSPPQSFMRSGFAATVTAAVATTGKDLGHFIEQEAAKG